MFSLFFLKSKKKRKKEVLCIMWIILLFCSWRNVSHSHLAQEEFLNYCLWNKTKNRILKAWSSAHLPIKFIKEIMTEFAQPTETLRQVLEMWEVPDSISTVLLIISSLPSAARTFCVVFLTCFVISLLQLTPFCQVTLWREWLFMFCN